jgi:hypothetical protein
MGAKKAISKPNKNAKSGQAQLDDVDVAGIGKMSVDALRSLAVTMKEERSEQLERMRIQAEEVQGLFANGRILQYTLKTLESSSEMRVTNGKGRVKPNETKVRVGSTIQIEFCRACGLLARVAKEVRGAIFLKGLQDGLSIKSHKESGSCCNPSNGEYVSHTVKFRSAYEKESEAAKAKEGSVSEVAKGGAKKPSKKQGEETVPATEAFLAIRRRTLTNADEKKRKFEVLNKDCVKNDDEEENLYEKFYEKVRVRAILC